MKNAPLITVAFLVVIGVAWGIWAHHDSLNTAQSSAVPPSVVKPTPPPNQAIAIPSSLAVNPAHRVGNLSIQAIIQEYTVTRQKVLQDNPKLAEEGKEISDELIAQQKKLDKAMIKTDPKIKPIIAKLDAMRLRKMASAGTSEPKPAPITTTSNVSR